ncbi:MAG: endonuclease III [Candidatus Omnitrophica bacterium]|nr:endonuclease III [Candidatus Omnitrophota bacterium]
MNAQHKIRCILTLLNRAYGRPPEFRKSDPVDGLMCTILSQNTNDRNSLAAFAVLKKNFRTWDGLSKVDARTVARLIKRAGLANIKAKRIKEVLGEIKRREGKLSLASLARLDTGDALKYLKSLKGVGPKTAACVLLFSFGRPVMPVDTHIFRVTKRLGIIDKDLNIEEAHGVLSAIIPKHLIYGFHLGIIEHGRKTCKAQGPRCGSCILYRLCRFEKKPFYRKKEL